MPGLFAMTMAFGFMNTAFAGRPDEGEGLHRPVPVHADGLVGRRHRARRWPTSSTPRSTWPSWSPSRSCSAGAPAARSARRSAAFALLLWLRLALIFVGIWLGLMVKNTEAAGNLFALAFPFGMLSSVFAPPDLMPGWLGAVAAWNPVSSTAGAIRDLFEAPPSPADTGSRPTPPRPPSSGQWSSWWCSCPWPCGSTSDCPGDRTRTTLVGSERVSSLARHLFGRQESRALGWRRWQSSVSVCWARPGSRRPP